MCLNSTFEGATKTIVFSYGSLGNVECWIMSVLWTNFIGHKCYWKSHVYHISILKLISSEIPKHWCNRDGCWCWGLVWKDVHSYHLNILWGVTENYWTPQALGEKFYKWKTYRLPPQLPAKGSQSASKFQLSLHASLPPMRCFSRFQIVCTKFNNSWLFYVLW